MKAVRFFLLVACMLSLFAVCVSAEERTGGTDTTEMVADGAAFSVASASGEVKRVEDPSVAALKKAISSAKSGAVVTLYTDYVLKNIRTDSFTVPDGVSIDLNGHCIEAECELLNGIFRHASNKYSFRVYSSAPGAKLKTKGKGCLFYVLGTVSVGESAGGERFAKENLTLQTKCVATFGSGGAFSLSDATVFFPTEDTGSSPAAVFCAEKGRADCRIDGCRLFLLGADTVWKGKTAFAVTVQNSRLLLGKSAHLTVGAGTLTTEKDSSFSYPTPEKGDLPIAEGFPMTAEIGTMIGAPTEHLTATDGTFARIRKTILRLSKEEEGYLGEYEQDGLYYEAVPTEDALTAIFTETSDDGNSEYRELWKRGTLPSHAFPVYLGTYYHLVRADAPITEESVYTASVVRSTEPKVLGNLLLSESITFQFYLADDGILQGATAKDFRCDFSDEEATDGRIRFSVPADPKTLTEPFDLALPMSTGETYHVEISLSSYAESVMRLYPDVPANIRLAKALLAYVGEVSAYFYENGKLTEEPDAQETRRIRALLGEGYEVPAYTPDASRVALPRGGKAILSGALNLVSNPGYAFRLNPNFTGTVTIEMPERTEVFRVENGQYGGDVFLFVKEIGAGDFRSDITVYCVGDANDSLDMTFTYNLDTYMYGFGEEIPRYALALYDYVLSVEEYLKYGKLKP